MIRRCAKRKNRNSTISFDVIIPLCLFQAQFRVGFIVLKPFKISSWNVVQIQAMIRRWAKKKKRSPTFSSYVIMPLCLIHTVRLCPLHIFFTDWIILYACLKTGRIMSFVRPSVCLSINFSCPLHITLTYFWNFGQKWAHLLQIKAPQA